MKFLQYLQHVITIALVVMLTNFRTKNTKTSGARAWSIFKPKSCYVVKNIVQLLTQSQQEIETK